MAEAKMRLAWDQTAKLLQMVHATRMAGDWELDPAWCHPFYATDEARRAKANQPSPEEVKANWDAFKSIVTAGKFR